MNTNIYPIKTLHGTNQESLQNDYVNAMDKVREAIDSFRAIEFNARDYNSENFRQAKEDRNKQLLNLEQVFLYLEDIASNINY